MSESRLIYGVLWAEEIVEIFQAKYARGWKNFAQTGEITQRKLFSIAVEKLRGDQRSWEILKRSVKQLDLSPAPLHQPSGEQYLTYLRYMATDEWLDSFEKLSPGGACERV